MNLRFIKNKNKKFQWFGIIQNTVRHFVVGNGLNYGGYDNVPLPLDRHVHILLGIVSKSGDVVKRRYSADVTHEQHNHSLQFVNINNKNYGNFV